MSDPDGSALRYRVLSSADDPLLEPWLALYDRSFPPEEKVPVADHLKALASAESEWRVVLLAVTSGDEELVAMARYEFGGCVAYLPYLAVHEAHRGAGLGARIYHTLIDRVRAEAPAAAALVFEVERPEEAHGEAARVDAERRIRFYGRQGARLLTGIHYLQRVPDQPAVPMNLMVHPFRPLAPEAALALARELFEVERTAAPLELD